MVSLYGHELAHALVARAFGIPVRTISLFLLGGMAHITRESPSPRAEFLIAVVGPGVKPGRRRGRRAAELEPVGHRAAGRRARLVAGDDEHPAGDLQPGAGLSARRRTRAARACCGSPGEDLRWASTVAARVGQVAAVGLLFSGVWILFDGSSGALGGLWLIMIAWFMYAGAASSQYATMFQESLRRLTVASVMDRDFGRVQAGVSVQAFAEEHLLEKARRRRCAARLRGVSRRLPGRPAEPAAARPHPGPELVADEHRARHAADRIGARDGAERARAGALHLILEEGVEHIAVMAEGRLLGLGPALAASERPDCARRGDATRQGAARGLSEETRSAGQDGLVLPAATRDGCSAGGALAAVDACFVSSGAARLSD